MNGEDKIKEQECIFHNWISDNIGINEIMGRIAYQIDISDYPPSISHECACRDMLLMEDDLQVFPDISEETKIDVLMNFGL